MTPEDKELMERLRYWSGTVNGAPDGEPNCITQSDRDALAMVGREAAGRIEALLARVAELERENTGRKLAIAAQNICLQREAEFRALAERAAKERPCGECVDGLVDCGMQNDPDTPIYCTCIAGALRSFLAGSPK